MVCQPTYYVNWQKSKTWNHCIHWSTPGPVKGADTFNGGFTEVAVSFIGFGATLWMHREFFF